MWINPKPLPSKMPTATMEGDNGVVHFDASAVLVKRAPDTGKSTTPWKDGADHWRVTLAHRESGASIEVEYWTGIGNRKFPAANLAAPRTEDYYKLSRPVTPAARDVLRSICTDYTMFRDLPADEGKALDELAAEAGFTKPSEALETLRSLRKSADMLRTFAARAGLDVDALANHEWDA